MQLRKSKGCEIIWKHIRGLGGYNPSRRYLAVNMTRLLLDKGGGVFSASRRAKEMPSCRQAACLFTQHKPTQDLHRSKRPDRCKSQDGSHSKNSCRDHERICVCHLTSVWQAEVCNKIKLIMHQRHVSLSRGMGAERQAEWWSGETASAVHVQMYYDKYCTHL